MLRHSCLPIWSPLSHQIMPYVSFEAHLIKCTFAIKFFMLFHINKIKQEKEVIFSNDLVKKTCPIYLLESISTETTSKFITSQQCWYLHPCFLHSLWAFTDEEWMLLWWVKSISFQRTKYILIAFEESRTGTMKEICYLEGIKSHQVSWLSHINN